LGFKEIIFLKTIPQNMSMAWWTGSTGHGSQGLRSQLNEDRPIPDLQQRLKREGYVFSAVEIMMDGYDLMNL
jgi:hypothetical protein